MISATARRDCFVAALLAVTILAVFGAKAAPAAEQHCVKAPVVLWGDGRRDDTVALNAWLRGEEAIWADSGAPVGAVISGRVFRLTEAIYVRAGRGRTMHGFRLEWPERGETVSGGTIVAGSDPEKEPLMTGISIVGGDPGEGVPFDAPDDNGVPAPNREASCAVS